MNKFTIALLITLFVVAGCGTQTADGIVFKTADERLNIGFRLFYPPVPPVEPAVVPPTPTEVIYQATAQPEEELVPTVTPEPCRTIAGNINADGRKLWHDESSPQWSQIRIDESKGEMWFCDVASAEAAGWVKAGN